MCHPERSEGPGWAGGATPWAKAGRRPRPQAPRDARGDTPSSTLRSHQDQPGRGRLEGRAEEVAERGANRQPSRREHHRDLVEIVSANALQVALLSDCYPFVERAVGGIEPALDLRLAAPLALHELLELAMDVQIVEEEDRLFLHHAPHLVHDGDVLLL